MKRNVGSAKALAVILSATLALSPSITAAATAGDNTANLSANVEEAETKETAEATKETTEDKVSEKADESVKETENKSGKSEVVSEKAEEENAADKETQPEQPQEEVQSEEKEIASAEKTEESSEETSEEKTEENLPLFEEVDPQEEGLEAPVTAVDALETDVPIEEKDPDEQTRVIIVMEGDSVLDQGYDTENLADNSAAMNLSENIIAEQEETVEKISAEALDGQQLDVNYNLSIITNAVSADVAYKDIDNIVNVDGVAAVYVAQKYVPQETAEPMTITSGDMVGSYSTWANGYTGAGTRIAVIDTGIDSDHPSFDAAAFDAHLNETAQAAGKSVSDYNLLTAEEIASVLPNLNVAQVNGGVSADQLYLNEKIPFAFNYVDRDLEITHDNDNQGDHGTHVSGIATANYYVPNSAAESGFSRQETGVVGIAPDAQLLTMKVFGKGGGAYSDDYMAAIEDAILLKCDVVNLSLGSSAAGYSSDSETYINDVFDKLQGTSTVVSISAGNSGRWSDESTYGVNLSADVNQDTVGSPGSYRNALTVASAVNSGIAGNCFETEDGKKIFYSDGSESHADLFKTLDTSADGNGTQYPFVLIDGLGLADDYEGVDVQGKIVMVSRGSITFVEKHQNAEAAGAIACVVYNNQPGTIGMLLADSTATIPCVSITLADAQSILAGAEQTSETTYEGTVTVSAKVGLKTDVPDGYTMSTFSSYGVPGTLDLKPEITAPGGNIYSTLDNGTYGVESGTSMAAPSIAGQSALVEQYIRENDLANKEGLSVRTLAQTLLMSTAIPLHEDNDPDGLEYSPRSQGAGLANVYNAVTTPAYILVGGKDGNDGKVKITLGDDPSRSGNYSFSFDIHNLTDKEQFFVLDSSVLTEQIYEQDGFKYFYGTSHQLNPSVSLSASDTALVYDLNNDGAVDLSDRSQFLSAVNGSVELPIVDEHDEYFDLNKDGVVNTKDVYLFGKQIRGAADVANLGLTVVRVNDVTTIDVNVNLSEDDRNYLSGFENGMYVDGFIYAKGNVDLSIPFLAFYGSWMDSSMYEPFDFMQYVHDPNYDGQTYVGLSETNFLSVYPMGSANENYFIPNLFADDAKYIEDRNAISSLNGTVLGSQYYSLIRNANRVIITISDKNTGEVYFENVEYENYASFVYEGQWKNYIQWQDLNWAGTDAKGNPLEDGTEVEITLEAVPSYYDNVEDPKTLDGKGLYLTTPMAIDNTKPVIADAAKAAEGKYDITVYDNRYTAAVLVIANDKSTILGRYAVNQETKDQDAVVTIDAPEDVFYVEVFDYAGNASVYRFNNTGHADTKFVTDITVDKQELEVTVGRTAQIKATVSPKWLAEGYDAVAWESSDPDVAAVSQSGTVLGKKEGTAVITVTTLATDKKGNNLSAQVNVTVVGRPSSGKTGADEEQAVKDDKKSVLKDDKKSAVKDDEKKESDETAEDASAEKSSVEAVETEKDAATEEVTEEVKEVTEEVKEDKKSQDETAAEASEAASEASSEAGSEDEAANDSSADNSEAGREASSDAPAEDVSGGENDD